MIRTALIVAGFLLPLAGYAQIDTEFWFAPPEVTAGHGDRPIFLRISTLEQAAVVSVVQPARGNAQVAAANVAANTTHTIDLTAQIANLETGAPAVVLRTGIRIISSAPITVYYEVGAGFNADIFPLKGRNALGNSFVIPAQNFYNNSSDYSPLPSSSFDIVATLNNTVVRVRPTKPLVGHLSDTLITVKLNAGETYSFRKTTLSAQDNPAGTIVESNKPIAITIKDDSVINGGCRDLLGDQLVPVEVAGTEYVVLKGFLNTAEYLFITATEDDTEIYIQGSQEPVSILSAGEIHRHQVSEKSTYILASKTIYVFHVTGFGCEMGLAILPSINCKGSPQIGFTRTTNEFFGLNVLVQKEGISNFRLNGSFSLIPASAFTAVPGTGDKWYTAQLSFDTNQIRVGQASLISNDRFSFQVGIINGNAASTCRYGYFSSFSTLFIGDDLDFCEGETATLDAGPGKESYTWSTGATSQKIEIASAGEYWVRVEREDCVLYDTIKVAVKKGHLDLGSDLEVCFGDTARVDGKENFSWLWSDGSNRQILETTKAGKYWVSVHDYTGCLASDTVNVSLKELPPVDLGPDVMKCRNDDITLDAQFSNATYLWHDAVTTPSRLITSEGTYAVTLTWNGCQASDSIVIENLPGPPQDTIYGTPSVCPFSTEIDYTIEDIPGSSYAWLVNGGTFHSVNENTVYVNWFDASASATLKAIVTDGSGCKGDTITYPVRINVVLMPELPAGPDTLCLNKSEGVAYNTRPTNGSIFSWHIAGGEIISGQNSPEVAVNWREGFHELWIEETSVTPDTVCKGTSQRLKVLVFNDTTDIVLNSVSTDTANASILYVDWLVGSPNTVDDKQVSLFKRPFGTSLWNLLKTMPVTETTLPDGVDFATESVLEYYLTLTTLCDLQLATAVHNNIFLAGQADTSELITLNWNHYFGWPGGVDRYELWRKTDAEPGYRFLTNISAFENMFSKEMADDGFQHRYVIRAVEKGGLNESWSNPISFDFEHPVEIPNIITPNGDEFNEYFHISKIHLYRNSVLRIIDRWGKEVFHSVGYKNDWDGGGLSSGVYFYLLDLKRDNKVYRGSLTIL